MLTLMIDFELSAQRVGGYLAFLLDSDSSQTLLRHLGAHSGELSPGAHHLA